MKTSIFKNTMILNTVNTLVLFFMVGTVVANTPSFTNSGTRANAWAEEAAQTTHFLENKGQVKQTDGTDAPYVSHLLQRGSTNIYLLREAGIAYQFNRTHYPVGYDELMNERHPDIQGQERLEEMRKEVRLETYRMDMRLVGADPHAEIVTEGKSADYTNYYNHDALEVHHYEKVTYKEVYPGIDWVVYTTEQGMKYDFVLQPGADPDQIAIAFDHQEELYVDMDGNLIHGNRMGSFTEKAPVSFQNGKDINTRFVLQGNLLRFTLKDYDAAQALTIDPARIWGTYYGANGGELGYSCAVDGNDNVYLAGRTSSTSAIASGGHQNTLVTATDAFLVKFNSAGVRQWGTYYGDGGAGWDVGWSCAVDGSSNVYLAGETNSTTGIASDGHQNTIGGNNANAFLVKFNSVGIRLWGTYYGGGGGTISYSCAVDGSDNVYLAGRTTSSGVIASGGHQNATGGGIDAFLVKFSSAGIRQWGTYYGANGGEIGYCCAVDGSDNVYLAGQTSSGTDIASGGHQNTIGGDQQFYSDAFLVKFNSAGIRQWGTYYGGSLSDDGWSCAVDGSGNVYLAGTTSSTSGISSGGHQGTHGGSDRDAFLVKFNSSGIRQWGTYYGGSEWDWGQSCAVDGSGNVYLAGYTYSESDIASDGFQNVIEGSWQDAYLVKFNSAGVRQWSTYYGGSLSDEGWSCAVGGSGNVYLAGTTQGGPIASGGHQNDYGLNWDAFLVKFESDSSPTSATIADMGQQQVTIYPNPTTGQLIIDLGTASPDAVIELYDMQGRLLATGPTNSQQQIPLEIDGPAGVYMLRVVSGEGTVNKRIIKQ